MGARTGHAPTQPDRLEGTDSHIENSSELSHDHNYDYNIEDRSQIPYLDELTRFLIDDAIETLAVNRSPQGPRDSGAPVSGLLSLRDQADDALTNAVADARRHGYSWDDIAMRLATTAAAARRRYATLLPTVTEPPLEH
jgi:hypothetical protein